MSGKSQLIKKRIYATYAYGSEVDETGFGWNLLQWESMVLTFILNVYHVLQTVSTTFTFVLVWDHSRILTLDLGFDFYSLLNVLEDVSSDVINGDFPLLRLKV
jgi:hypothetical protein